MANVIYLEHESPFQPYTPVKPEYFKGRSDVLKKILRYLNKSMKCDVQHFFLTGQRGMGKTSIAEFIMEGLAEFNILPIYVSNKNNDSVDVLVSKIMKALANKLPNTSKKDKIKTWFGNHVSEINIQGNKIKFDLDKSKEEEIKNNFLEYLLLSFEDFKDNYQSMFIVIDDINGLSESKEFVDWYKEFADTVAVDKSYQLPVYFLLEGYPDKFDNLVELEPSFGRIFHYADVDLLDENEVKSFFVDTFNMIDISIDDDALDFMIEYTSGVPLTMQYIGDSVFWNLNRDNISIIDAKEGVINAAKGMGNIQLRRTLKRLDNPLYEVILTKIASKKLTTFTADDLKEVLTENEMDNWANCINTVLELDIIQQDDYYDKKYSFKDKTYFTYFHIKSFENEYNS